MDPEKKAKMKARLEAIRSQYKLEYILGETRADTFAEWQTIKFRESERRKALKK